MNQQNETISDTSGIARARSCMYGLLAAVMRHPDSELLSALRSMSQDTVISLGDVFVKNVERLSQTARATDVTALAERHGMRVGHAVRGTCPPYELEYADGEIIQRASELADIAGFYEAFGLSSAGPEHDRPDHFSAECEFLQVMTAKEALALDAGEDSRVRDCRDTQASFLRAHWLQWVPAFAVRLIEAEPDDFYGRAAHCMQAMVDDECTRFGIQSGPTFLELRPADPDKDTSIDCAPDSTSELIPLVNRVGSEPR